MKKLLIAALALAAAGAALADNSITYTDSTGKIVAGEVFRGTGTTDSGVQRVGKKGKVLFDSGVVASGAIINSPVLDLTGVETLEVFVDNTASTAVRDLTLTSYLDDGTTTIDTLVVRKVAFGAAYTGSQYAPGAVRVLVGPNPPAPPSGSYVLMEMTSAANTPINTGGLFCEDFDAILVDWYASAGTTQVQLYEQKDDGVTNVAVSSPSTAAQQGLMPYGLGVGVGANMAWTTIGGGPVGKRILVTTSAAGAANTVKLRISGRGRPPGTGIIPMLLPTKAKLSLAAAGSANGRMTIVGR